MMSYPLASSAGEEMKQQGNFFLLPKKFDNTLSNGAMNNGDPLYHTVLRNVFSSHETVAMMPFSSGTTGLPKGVMLSHRNLVTNHVILKYLQSLNELSTINIYDSTLLAMPIYHMYGYNVTMNTLMTGGKVIILPKFSVRLYFEAIQNYKVTFAPLVPYIANLLVDSPMMKKYDLSSLLGFATGSAPIAETTLSALMQKVQSSIKACGGLSVGV
ncbi:hypothetical protein SK128_014657 [Halocaridina rubra]|uniref:AMP-dependent synthetase/ligase domain-containing protein n=1 Tax=Halocaridina rubra TaxID=373956 RepID=A0AAN8WEJ0_HALRR